MNDKNALEFDGANTTFTSPPEALKEEVLTSELKDVKRRNDEQETGNYKEDTGAEQQAEEKNVEENPAVDNESITKASAETEEKNEMNTEVSRDEVKIFTAPDDFDRYQV